MSSEIKYNTNQRQEILKYLESNEERHVTIDEIMEYFKNQKIKIGLTTVYRYLNSLEKDGYLKKIKHEEKKAACYQLVSCDNHHDHVHMICMKCDTLFHGELIDVSQVEKDALKNYGFEVDKSQMIIYGICEDCRSV